MSAFFSPLLLAGLLAAPVQKPVATHPFGWEDMFAMVRLADPQPSPDGRRILFGHTEYDIQRNQGNSDLSWVELGSGAVRRLTWDPASDVNGRWSSEGRSILFLSSRSGSMQLWRLPVDGGEALRVSDLPVDVEGFELSPDGNRILFWAGVFPDCTDLACTAARLKAQAESPVKARLFEKLFIRHWDTWNDGRRNHLFVMPVAGGAVVDLMVGWDQDCPSKPWGGSDEFDWSPDGRQVAFSSKPSAGEAWNTNHELYLVSADGKDKPRLLTADNHAWDTHPRFAPDGRSLAALAMVRPGFEADRFRVVIFDLPGGKRRVLTESWDRSVEQLVWSADGKVLYAVAAENARVKIFSVGIADGKIRPLVEEGSNHFLARAPDGSLVYLRDRLVHPREVFKTDPATGRTEKVTDINDEQLARLRLSQPEEFWFDHDGFRIHAWLLPPVGLRPGTKAPLAFLVHGGPQGFWGDDFHYRWNPQFYAGAGYAVVAVDFRGSTSYGQAFTDAIRANWGPGPYSDLMAGLREALQRAPYIDRQRMCALGASYGGYMANWIAGQDHPFRCLVSHDGDFDLSGAYFNTEELWFPEWEMTGTPWEQREVYERNSPSRFVQKWKTPMLVIQGGLDFRVVETESYSTFNALQRRGVPSQLLVFPDENHWILKPQNSRLWHWTVLQWLDRWTGTKRPGSTRPHRVK